MSGDGICQVDRGEALTVRFYDDFDELVSFQIGIKSFGSWPCEVTNHPIIYTFINLERVRWIKENMKP